ncbi:MAG: polysaccharide biosynthesis/export family protein [Sphingorhabdus sp.]|nr:polysaccharide biosynthesis/export family protein [Sphingorhabdus sp.]
MKFKSAILLASALNLSACATMEQPGNGAGSIYAAQQVNRTIPVAAPKCHSVMPPAEIQNLRFVPAPELAASPDLLAAGDRLRLMVSGDKDQLTKIYVIASDGSIELQGQLRIHASGKTVSALQAEIAQQLVARQLVRNLSNGVRISQVELAGVPVSVSGAVFEKGTVRVGERQAEMRNLNISNDAAGDMNIGRSVTTALRAAGGARPDADPRSVYLIRGAVWTQLDLSGALDGSFANDLPVTAGDRIIIPSVGCAQDYMFRPSAITAPGIRVYMSNLSRPGSNNASSAIGKETTSLPYGTRFLQGLVAANCVGGSAMNAGRSAVLISRNPVTGQSIVISRSVEKLVREADRDAYDPYLMPGDSIVCYDSAAMNLRDVISTVGEVVSPYVLFSNVNK